MSLCPPSDGNILASAEERQRQTCKDGLAAAKAAKIAFDMVSAKGVVELEANKGGLPWERAAQMEVGVDKFEISSVS